MSAPPARLELAAAAALELAAGLILLEPVVVIAEDASSPRYRLDAGERRELADHIGRFTAWRGTHAQLVAWARRQAGPRARPAPPLHREPGRW